jgi:hypothetical protein
MVLVIRLIRLPGGLIGLGIRGSSPRRHRPQAVHAIVVGDHPIARIGMNVRSHLLNLPASTHLADSRLDRYRPIVTAHSCSLAVDPPDQGR